MRRTINQPLGLDQPTYFRLRIRELTDSGWADRGMHNQPFPTRDAAEFAAVELRQRIRRAAPSKSVAVEIVTITSSLR